MTDAESSYKGGLILRYAGYYRGRFLGENDLVSKLLLQLTPYYGRKEINILLPCSLKSEHKLQLIQQIELFPLTGQFNLLN